jgi:membrane associated rhomboid family serine protease
MIPLKDNVRLRAYPFLTIILVLLNTLVFVLQVQQGPQAGALILRYATTPSQIMNWRAQPFSLLTLITSMFLHGGWLHLIGNMIYLWFFGRKVESAMGPLRYLGFYMLSGVLSSMIDVIFSAQSSIPSLGASGAIAGVLAAYMMMYPWARVWVWFPVTFWMVFPVPAVVGLGFWFVMQLFNGITALNFGTAQAGGIAWWAHIGGFVVGMIFGPLFRFQAEEKEGQGKADPIRPGT